MKKILFLAVIIGANLSSCSKKSNPQPTSQKPATSTVPTLTVTTFAGGGLNASTDGTGTSAQFSTITKLTSDQAGNIYVLEAENVFTNLFFKIRKVTPSGTTSTLFNGGFETFVNNQPVQKSKVYNIFDIASDLSGNLYVLGFLTDYSKTINGSYYQEWGIYRFNASSGSLIPFSISIGQAGDPSYIAPYNSLTNIAVDASGNVFGVNLNHIGNTPFLGTIYQINSSIGTLFSNVGNLTSQLYAEGDGNVYAITTTSIVKINGTQPATTLYTIPNDTLAFESGLMGNQSGTLYGCGTLYNSSKKSIGIGIYKLSANGTLSNAGIFSSDPGILTDVADESGNIYFAVRFLTTNNSGGWIIQKVSLN